MDNEIFCKLRYMYYSIVLCFNFAVDEFPLFLISFVIFPGDYEGAVDTLRMAITLIKQSLTAGTEASQILIQSLQDCLHGIDEQAAMAK